MAGATRARAVPTPASGGFEPEAIFVVGVSRSGTTLMRGVLNGHSRVAIAPENHYLGHLLPGRGARDRFRREGSLADDVTVRRIVELIYSPAFLEGTRVRPSSPFWHWVGCNVSRTDLEARLLAAERTERGIFLALLRLYGDRTGKAVVGEKTPAHIRCAGTLLAWFPNGRVVHMVRDPRGVFVSELRRRHEAPNSIPYRWLVHLPPLFRWFVLLETAWAWAEAVRHHRGLSRSYPGRYLVVRFEDLVREPELTIGAVCAFLGLVPEPSMLDQKVTSRGARLGEVGFDADAADRWRATIRASEAALLSALLGHRFAEFGYPQSVAATGHRRPAGRAGSRTA